jgi:hypothetical protein
VPSWLQHAVVLLVVCLALFVVVRQAVAALRAGNKPFGSCCAKGCPSTDAARSAGPERVVFLPRESLGRGKAR